MDSAFRLRPALSIPDLSCHPRITEQGTFSAVFRPPIPVSSDPSLLIPCFKGKGPHLPVVPSPIAGHSGSRLQRKQPQHDHPMQLPLTGESPVASHTRAATAMKVATLAPPPGLCPVSSSTTSTIVDFVNQLATPTQVAPNSNLEASILSPIVTSEDPVETPSQRASSHNNQPLHGPTPLKGSLERRSAKRKKSTLCFSLPIVNAITCTERRCDEFFSATNWASLKFDIKMHLHAYHNITINETRYLCSICDKHIKAGIGNHSCLRDLPTSATLLGSPSSPPCPVVPLSGNPSPAHVEIITDQALLELPLPGTDLDTSAVSTCSSLASPNLVIDLNMSTQNSQLTAPPIDAATSPAGSHSPASASSHASTPKTDNDISLLNISGFSSTAAGTSSSASSRDSQSPAINLDASQSSLDSEDRSPTRYNRRNAERSTPPIIHDNNAVTTQSSTDLPPTANSAFPGTTSRNGKDLHLVFPIVGSIKCTEPQCGREFVGGYWTSSKQSLLRHLRRAHRLRALKIKRWCSVCQEPIATVQISAHRCLTGSAFYAPQGTSTTFHHECEKCQFSCPSLGGLKNHMRSHRENDLRLKIQVAKEAAARRNQPRNSNQSASLPSTDQSNTNEFFPTLTDDTTDAEIQRAPSDAERVEVDFNDAREDEVLDPDNPSPSEGFIKDFKALFSTDRRNRWEKFTDLLENYIRFAQDYVNLPPPKEERSDYKAPNPNDPRVIQRIYRHNRRRAVRLITDPKSTRCGVPVEKLANHFCPSPSSLLESDIFTHPCPARLPPDETPFTADEIWAKLGKAENTAPGPDRLTYNHWRSVDPEGRTLAIIFNICMDANHVPDTWKMSTTVMIPKRGGGDSPEDWRPIALSCTIAKLFSGCISKRLSHWIEQYNILSPVQKGFVPFDGSFENNYVLDHLIQDARRSQKELCITSIDFTNAFGSITHAALLKATSLAGIGERYTNLIASLYNGSFTSFMTDDGISPPYPILSGVRQGCPLSGLLFNMVIDPLLRKIQGTACEPKALAFADDVLIIARSTTEMETTLNTALEIAKLIGININAKKCFSLHLGGTPFECLPTIFSIEGNDIPFLQDGESATFLGKQVGFSIIPSDSPMEKFYDTGVKLMTSYLAPWQRIDAMKCFFFPSLSYAERIGQYKKTEWAKLDDVLRPHFKNTLYLPSKACNSYLYGHQRSGLLGIPLSAEDCDISAIDGAFKLISSDDPRIRIIAWNDLASFTEARIHKKPSAKDMAEFLSGRPYPDSDNPISSTWTRARSASARLHINWNLHEDKSVSLGIGEEIVTDRKKVFKSIRNLLKNEKTALLKRLPHQGKTAHWFGRDKASSHFNRTGDFTRFADWRFIHRARLSQVPLNAYQFDNRPTNCRRCGATDETLPHVLCHCKRYMPNVTRRHNAIVTRVKVAAAGRWEVLSENQAIARSNLRPDLVLRKGDSVLIIDVTVPFENGPDSLTLARKEKVKKYEGIAAELRKRYKDVRVEAIVVGALGSWDPGNNRIVDRLCSRKYSRLMKRLIVSDTIRSSRDQYTEFLTGVPQESDAHRYIRTSHNNDASHQQVPDTSARRSRYGRSTRRNPASQDSATPLNTDAGLSSSSPDDYSVHNEHPRNGNSSNHETSERE